PEQFTIHRRFQPDYSLDSCSNEELLKFYRLLEAAPALLEQKKSILMIASNSAEIFRLLSTLLLLLPLAERVACSFDTFVENCTPAAGRFWAVGSTRALNNSNFLPMHLGERQIVSPLSGSVSLYSTWF